MADDANVRLERALLSLEGLSVGDALGQRFFFQGMRAAILIALRETPPRRWDYTDDTRMALSILAVLHEHGTIDQDALALHFARLYVEDPRRGYGPAMHELLPALHFGESWRDAAVALFDGNGSYGNGAAMRVAPLGAYFADDVEQVVALAERSAVVTHAHPEAVAGAVAVAVAAAFAARSREGSRPRGWRAFLDAVLHHVPESEVRSRLLMARDLRSGLEIGKVVSRLGNGSLVSAQDTVPFVLWCAAHYLDNFEAAVWKALSGMGDLDTNAAMVGGIVAPAVGWDGIPLAWRDAREPLPDWLPRP